MQVSVVIPTYNRAALLQQALASVFSQTHQNLQVIVADDGSTDAAATLLGEFQPRVQYLRMARNGIGAARNRGIEAATGEYIAFLDSDDLWRPHKIERQLQFAADHPEAVATYTDAVEFSPRGTDPASFVEKFPALRQPARLFTPLIAEYAVPLTSSTMVRTSYLRATGMRFSSHRVCEDLALFLDILLAGGGLAYLPEKLTMRRQHDSNISGNHRLRFEQRKLLYAGLIARPGPRTPAQAAALKRGLRDARYRIGECLWADLDLAGARAEFFSALAPDPTGMRALGYGLLSYFPASFLARARRLKQGRLERRPEPGKG